MEVAYDVSGKFTAVSHGRIKGFVGVGSFGDSKSIVGTTVYYRVSGLREGGARIIENTDIRTLYYIHRPFLQLDTD
jgi:hypothetical protein